MKRLMVPLSAVVLMGCSTTSPTTQHLPSIVNVQSAQLSEDDRSQIGAIVAQWESAWNTHDMHAFALLFHENATFVIWTGRVLQGRQAIEDGHAAAHRSYFRDSTQLSAIQEITPLGPDIVVVRSLTTLTGDSRQPEITIHGHKLLVITRRDKEWRILYGQNTRLAPDVAAALPNN